MAKYSVAPGTPLSETVLPVSLDGGVMKYDPLPRTPEYLGVEKINLRQQLYEHERSDADDFWWGVGGMIFQFSIAGFSPGLSGFLDLALMPYNVPRSFSVGRQLGQVAQNLLNTLDQSTTASPTEAHELRHMTNIDDVPGLGGYQYYRPAGPEQPGLGLMQEASGYTIPEGLWEMGYRLGEAGVEQGWYGPGSDFFLQPFMPETAYPTNQAIVGYGPPTFEQTLRETVMDLVPGAYLPEPLWWDPVPAPDQQDWFYRFEQRLGGGAPEGVPVPFLNP
jgi:hypothetical protein